MQLLTENRQNCESITPYSLKDQRTEASYVRLSSLSSIESAGRRSEKRPGFRSSWLLSLRHGSRFQRMTHYLDCRTRQTVRRLFQRSRGRLRRGEMLGDVLVGELPQRFVLAARVFSEDHEFRRFYGRRNADTLRASRLWAPGRRLTLLSACRLVVVRAHVKVFGRSRRRRRRA